MCLQKWQSEKKFTWVNPGTLDELKNGWCLNQILRTKLNSILQNLPHSLSHPFSVDETMERNIFFIRNSKPEIIFFLLTEKNVKQRGADQK